MPKLAISRGLTVLVDEADFARVAKYKWSAKPAMRSSGGFYASRTMNRTSFFMHRLILDAPKGMFVDHINGNGLDNRRCNLRLATPSQNGAYKQIPVGRSGFRGVHWSSNQWRVIVEYENVPHRVGYFRNPVLAALAYDEKAKELFGEFAVLNFSYAENAS